MLMFSKCSQERPNVRGHSPIFGGGIWLWSLAVNMIGYVSLRRHLRDFPGGTVVKNPPAGLPWWRSG